MFVMFAFVISCAPLQVKDGPESFIFYAEKTVTGAKWIKGVTDLVIGTGCVSGKIKPSVCEKYDELSKYVSIAMTNVDISIASYKKTGSVLSQEQVQIALEELLKLVFKLDVIYKTPIEDIKDV